MNRARAAFQKELRTKLSSHHCRLKLLDRMGENHFTPVPSALYEVVLLPAAIAYYILQSLIIAKKVATRN
jgi:hypothetical protein